LLIAVRDKNNYWAEEIDIRCATAGEPLDVSKNIDFNNYENEAEEEAY
jgi:hypothetical protein